jgi:hypothetical protein
VNSPVGTIDFEAIRVENRDWYGRGIRNTIEPTVNLYSEKIHLVFELLQNAEDALRKRNKPRTRSVRFDLSGSGLRLSHNGKPFDEDDIRGICGVNQSTKRKELTAIGRFGIGFKSVYAVTDCPEVRSGRQQFVIRDYVYPHEVEPVELSEDETIFWFPFRDGDDSVFDEIAEGLEKLDAKALLFLRHVEELEWRIEDGSSGAVIRESTDLQPGLRRIALVESSSRREELSGEEWLVFSRPVQYEDEEVGSVEIAYSVDSSAPVGELRLKTTPDSRLAAFFPTGVQTNLGVLLQAPYQTTPARDNVAAKAPWNLNLFGETASLLVESLGVLRDMGALSVDVLCGMPIDEDDFPEGSMFRPLYDAVAEALRTQELLPKNDKGWMTSTHAALARGQELCELLDSAQLTTLFASNESLQWLSDGITIDRTSELRTYLMREHDIREIQPQTFVSRVSKEFLEAQTDEWVSKLYEFLAGQSYLWKTASNLRIPWVRLENKSHVSAHSGELPNAFLPSKATSGFPTVRTTVCQSEEALGFLKGTLKLTEPDPVDDVIVNILPLYEEGLEHENLNLYREHLRAIETAYENRNTRDKLVTALKARHWIPSIDSEGNKDWLTPFDCYLPTEKLKQLFEGVPGINFMDDSISGLQGESMRNILLACGAARYLDTEGTKIPLSSGERLELRRKWGDTDCTRDEGVDDETLYGLDGILKRIADLPFEEASSRCQMLWDALADVVQDKREGVVKASYSWFYYTTRSMSFDAAFIRTLKQSPWIPTTDGKLVSPDEVVFEHIEPTWSPNAVLQTVLKFRPSALAQLADATGWSLELLTRIKKSGLSDEEVLERLGLGKESEEGESGASDGDSKNGEGDGSSGAGSSNEGEAGGGASGNGNLGESDGAGFGGNGGRSSSGGSNSSSGGGASSSSSNKNSHAGRREFFSYLKTHPVEVEDDEFSDSETHEERMQVEKIAIDHILKFEPDLQRTPAGNKGFDLFGTDADGQTNRWIEVKAMVGTLANHPVGMSKAQFEMALEKGFRYWLYIVENATSDEPRILRIQDPAGNARTFTLDEGWREIAKVSQVNVETGEVKL